MFKKYYKNKMLSINLWFVFKIYLEVLIPTVFGMYALEFRLQGFIKIPKKMFY